MKLAIGSDHGGFLAKEELKKFLIEKGYEIIDVGTNSQDSCDYPIFASKVANLVVDKSVDKGIVICTTGEGVCITANRYKGVRCGIAFNDDVAHLMVQHNDCNVIAFSAKFTSIEDIKNRTLIFLNEHFEGGRHQRRVDEIESI